MYIVNIFTYVVSIIEMCFLVFFFIITSFYDSDHGIKKNLHKQ